jgi:hypothetical protein
MGTSHLRAARDSRGEGWGASGGSGRHRRRHPDLGVGWRVPGSVGLELRRGGIGHTDTVRGLHHARCRGGPTALGVVRPLGRTRCPPTALACGPCRTAFTPRGASSWGGQEVRGCRRSRRGNARDLFRSDPGSRCRRKPLLALGEVDQTICSRSERTSSETGRVLARPSAEVTWTCRRCAVSATARAPSARVTCCRPRCGSFHSAMTLDGSEPDGWLRHAIPSAVRVRTELPGSSASAPASARPVAVRRAEVRRPASARPRG